MDRTELVRRVTELEENIKETDELMRKAWISTELMPEPYKSLFIETLNNRQIQLETNRGMLKLFKEILER